MILHPHTTRPRANFFLVGAPKAGTTSIDRLLRSHPDVFLSPIKEPCHFCPDVTAQLKRQLGSRAGFDLPAYLASPDKPVIHFLPVASPEDYARLFDGAGQHRVVGECSTYYLSSSSAAANIHTYNPDARIMIVVRTPIDRIRSHYAMDRSLGLADRSLLAHVQEELALGESAHWGNSRYYVGASRYAQQIERYHRYFPPEQICVLSFEKLISQPEVELRRAFEFLGLPAPDTLALPIANKSRAARFPLLHAGLRKSGLKPLVAGLLDRGAGTRLGQAAKSVYYREKFRVASGEELAQVRNLLRKEGLDCPMADAA